MQNAFADQVERRQANEDQLLDTVQSASIASPLNCRTRAPKGKSEQKKRSRVTSPAHSKSLTNYSQPPLRVKLRKLSESKWTVVNPAAPRRVDAASVSKSHESSSGSETTDGMSSSSTNNEGSLSSDGHSEQKEDNKCLCGEEKPFSIQRIGFCNNCKNYVCMHMTCKSTSRSSNTVKVHSSRQHPAEKYNPSFDPLHYCPCEKLKQFVSRRRRVEICPNVDCNRLWCKVAGCGSTYKCEYLFHKHYADNHADLLANDVDVCGNCGEEEKDRDGIRKRAICPNCFVHWCLEGACAWEFVHRKGLLKHQRTSAHN